MINKLLITGAAGGVGTLVHDKLTSIAKTVRYSDIKEPTYLSADMEFIPCDLSNKAAVFSLLKDCDAILHLGGISTENTFDNILQANIVGVQNLYEAARHHNYPRIFLASSNHVVGFYKQDEWLDSNAPHRPDSWYGVSKSFAEAVAHMYYHKFGQETAIVRIGSCFPTPKDHRMLATWFSADDLVALLKQVVTVPKLGCPIIYGVSNNDCKWWDNSPISYLGWQAKDNSQVFANEIYQTVPMPDKNDPTSVYQGGSFTAAPIVEATDKSN